MELKRIVTLPTSTDTSEQESNSMETETSEQKKTPSLSATQVSRAEAITHLRAATDYFREHEPHSPIPFLLERAIAWSKLGFKELMLEVIQDDNSRNHVYHLTGIDNNTN